MNKYLQYNSIDFAQEPSFIRWVNSSDADDEIFWQQWALDHPEKKEEIEKAKLLVSQIVFKKEKVDKDIEDKVWSEINKVVQSNTGKSIADKTSSTTKINSKGKLIRLMSLAAVAAMAIFFIMVGAGNNYDTTIETQFAKTKEITLPDGSLVFLNADSRLEYDKKSWQSNRELVLQGEGFFEVQKGSNFVVKTKKGDVSVLGTSFNIYQRKEEFKVHCATGKVSVFASKNTTILTANQSVSIPDHLHSINKNVLPNENRSNWKQGIYTYKNETIQTVVKELERQLDLSIKIPDEVKEEQYTGSFNMLDKENALAEVFWPLGMEYQKEGKNIIVSKTSTK